MINLEHIAVFLLAMATSQFALALPDEELTVGKQQWRMVGGTSAPEFADVTYELVSEDGDSDGFAQQFLRFAIAKDPRSLEEMENQLTETFTNVQHGAELQGEGFYIREKRITDANVALPSIIVLTAIHAATNSHPHFGVQYRIKPHCRSCIKTAESWKAILAEGGLDQQALRLRHLLSFATHNADKRSFFGRLCDDYSSYAFSFMTTFGAAIFFGGKLLLGAMGQQGPCGNNMAVCKCGNM